MIKKLVGVTSMLLCVVLFQFSQPAQAQESKPLKKFEKKIDLQGAKSVEVQLSQSAGTLTINSGSGGLMEGLFAFSRDEWKPQVQYNTQNGQGKLLVKQVEEENLNMDEGDRNEWKVRLNNTVPMNMKLRIGAGQSTIDLHGMKLTKLLLEAGAGDFTVNLSNTSLPELDVNAGVGKMNLDLTGNWTNDLDAEIDGGIGEITLKLPRNTAVQVEVNGLGNIDSGGLKKEGKYYVNEAYNNSKATLHIEINGGLGSVTLQQEK